jgi:UDP-N-acetylglucosamine:LPS N-acetylglucosamine transferase
VAAIDRLDDERLRTMGRASAAAGRRDAAMRVLAILHEVARR